MEYVIPIYNIPVLLLHSHLNDLVSTNGRMWCCVKIGCCNHIQNMTEVDAASLTTAEVPQSHCHCPPCLSRAEKHLNAAVKTVGTLGLVFSLTEVFVLPVTSSRVGRGIARCPPIWLDANIFCHYGLNNAKFSQSILTKIDAAKCQILGQWCTKFDICWVFTPDPAGRAYSTPLDSLAGF